jgi:hypothetical protein
VAAAIVATACFVAWPRQAGAPPSAERVGPVPATLGAAGMSRGVPANGGELVLAPSAAGMPRDTAQAALAMHEAPAPVATMIEAQPAPAPPAPAPPAPAPLRSPPIAAPRPAVMPGPVSAAVAAAQAKADKFLRDGGGPAAPEAAPTAEAR